MATPSSLAFQAMFESEKLKFSQKVELVEVMTQCEMNNKYIVKTQSGQEVFKIKEKTSFATRCCCGSARPMKEVKFYALNPQNSKEKELLMTSRRSCACICFCGVFGNTFKFDTVDSTSNTSKEFAKITQRRNWCNPKFFIKYKSGSEAILDTKGMFCIDLFVPKKKKYTLHFEEEKVEIKHEFKLKNMISDADSYVIDLPSQLKESRERFENFILVLIAGCFVLDISYYEKSNDQNRGIIGYA